MNDYMSIRRKLFSSIISGIIIGFLIVAFPLIINLEKQIYLSAPRAAVQVSETSEQYIVKETENITTLTNLVPRIPSLGETEKIEVFSLSSSSFYSLYYILLISILAGFTSFFIIKKYLRI